MARAQPPALSLLFAVALPRVAFCKCWMDHPCPDGFTRHGTGPGDPAGDGSSCNADEPFNNTAVRCDLGFHCDRANPGRHPCDVCFMHKPCPPGMKRSGDGGGCTSVENPAVRCDLGYCVGSGSANPGMQPCNKAYFKSSVTCPAGMLRAQDGSVCCKGSKEACADGQSGATFCDLGYLAGIPNEWAGDKCEKACPPGTTWDGKQGECKPPDPSVTCPDGMARAMGETVCCQGSTENCADRESDATFCDLGYLVGNPHTWTGGSCDKCWFATSSCPDGMARAGGSLCKATASSDLTCDLRGTAGCDPTAVLAHPSCDELRTPAPTADPTPALEAGDLGPGVPVQWATLEGNVVAGAGAIEKDDQGSEAIACEVEEYTGPGYILLPSASVIRECGGTRDCAYVKRVTGYMGGRPHGNEFLDIGGDDSVWRQAYPGYSQSYRFDGTAAECDRLCVEFRGHGGERCAFAQLDTFVDDYCDRDGMTCDPGVVAPAVCNLWSCIPPGWAADGLEYSYPTCREGVGSYWGSHPGHSNSNGNIKSIAVRYNPCVAVPDPSRSAWAHGGTAGRMLYESAAEQWLSFRFTFANAYTQMVAGLGQHRALSADYEGGGVHPGRMDFALLNNNGRVSVRESGKQVWCCAETKPQSAAEEFKLLVSAGKVEYYKIDKDGNNKLLYESKAVPAYPLRVAASIYQSSCTGGFRSMAISAYRPVLPPQNVETKCKFAKGVAATQVAVRWDDSQAAAFPNRHELVLGDGEARRRGKGRKPCGAAPPGGGHWFFGAVATRKIHFQAERQPQTLSFRCCSDADHGAGTPGRVGSFFVGLMPNGRPHQLRRGIGFLNFAASIECQCDTNNFYVYEFGAIATPGVLGTFSGTDEFSIEVRGTDVTYKQGAREVRKSPGLLDEAASFPLLASTSFSAGGVGPTHMTITAFDPPACTTAPVVCDDAPGDELLKEACQLWTKLEGYAASGAAQDPDVREKYWQLEITEHQRRGTDLTTFGGGIDPSSARRFDGCAGLERGVCTGASLGERVGLECLVKGCPNPAGEGKIIDQLGTPLLERVLRQLVQFDESLQQFWGKARPRLGDAIAAAGTAAPGGTAGEEAAQLQANQTAAGALRALVKRIEDGPFGPANLRGWLNAATDELKALQHPCRGPDEQTRDAGGLFGGVIAEEVGPAGPFCRCACSDQYEPVGSTVPDQAKYAAGDKNMFSPPRCALTYAELKEQFNEPSIERVVVLAINPGETAVQERLADMQRWELADAAAGVDGGKPGVAWHDVAAWYKTPSFRRELERLGGLYNAAMAPLASEYGTQPPTGGYRTEPTVTVMHSKDFAMGGGLFEEKGGDGVYFFVDRDAWRRMVPTARNAGPGGQDGRETRVYAYQYRDSKLIAQGSLLTWNVEEEDGAGQQASTEWARSAMLDENEAEAYAKHLGFKLGRPPTHPFKIPDALACVKGLHAYADGETWGGTAFFGLGGTVEDRMEPISKDKHGCLDWSGGHAPVRPQTAQGAHWWSLAHGQWGDGVRNAQQWTDVYPAKTKWRAGDVISLVPLRLDAGDRVAEPRDAATCGNTRFAVVDYTRFKSDFLEPGKTQWAPEVDIGAPAAVDLGDATVGLFAYTLKDHVKDGGEQTKGREVKDWPCSAVKVAKTGTGGYLNGTYTLDPDAGSKGAVQYTREPQQPGEPPAYLCYEPGCGEFCAHPKTCDAVALQSCDSTLSTAISFSRFGGDTAPKCSIKAQSQWPTSGALHMACDKGVFNTVSGPASSAESRQVAGSEIEITVDVVITGKRQEDAAPVRAQLYSQWDGNRFYGVGLDNSGIQDVEFSVDNPPPGPIVFQQQASKNPEFESAGWGEYKVGFGGADSWWLGNEALHRLTTKNRYGLRIELTNYEGVTKTATYDSFVIGDEASQYSMTVSNTSHGDLCGGNLHRLNGPFSTRDRDNDAHRTHACATSDGTGGWWYKNCHFGTLNGRYEGKKEGGDESVSWFCDTEGGGKHYYEHLGTSDTRNLYSYKKTRMLLVPMVPDLPVAGVRFKPTLAGDGPTCDRQCGDAGAVAYYRRGSWHNLASSGRFTASLVELRDTNGDNKLEDFTVVGDNGGVSEAVYSTSGDTTEFKGARGFVNTNIPLNLLKTGHEGYTLAAYVKYKGPASKGDVQYEPIFGSSAGGKLFIGKHKDHNCIGVRDGNVVGPGSADGFLTCGTGDDPQGIFTDDKYHSVIFSQSPGGAVALYVDGVGMNQTAGAKADPGTHFSWADTLLVGASRGGAGEDSFWTGLVRDVVVLHTATAPAAAAAIHQAFAKGQARLYCCDERPRGMSVSTVSEAWASDPTSDNPDGLHNTPWELTPGAESCFEPPAQGYVFGLGGYCDAALTNGGTDRCPWIEVHQGAADHERKRLAAGAPFAHGVVYSLTASLRKEEIRYEIRRGDGGSSVIATGSVTGPGPSRFRNGTVELFCGGADCHFSQLRVQVDGNVQPAVGPATESTPGAGCNEHCSPGSSGVAQRRVSPCNGTKLSDLAGRGDGLYFFEDYTGTCVRSYLEGGRLLIAQRVGKDAGAIWLPDGTGSLPDCGTSPSRCGFDAQSTGILPNIESYFTGSSEFTWKTGLDLDGALSPSTSAPRASTEVLVVRENGVKFPLLPGGGDPFWTDFHRYENGSLVGDNRRKWDQLYDGVTVSPDRVAAVAAYELCPDPGSFYEWVNVGAKHGIGASFVNGHCQFTPGTDGGTGRCGAPWNSCAGGSVSDLRVFNFYAQADCTGCEAPYPQLFGNGMTGSSAYAPTEYAQAYLGLQLIGYSNTGKREYKTNQLWLKVPERGPDQCDFVDHLARDTRSERKAVWYGSATPCGEAVRPAATSAQHLFDLGDGPRPALDGLFFVDRAEATFVEPTTVADGLLELPPGSALQCAADGWRATPTAAPTTAAPTQPPTPAPTMASVNQPTPAPPAAAGANRTNAATAAAAAAAAASTTKSATTAAAASTTKTLTTTTTAATTAAATTAAASTAANTTAANTTAAGPKEQGEPTAASTTTTSIPSQESQGETGAISGGAGGEGSQLSAGAIVGIIFGVIVTMIVTYAVNQLTHCTRRMWHWCCVRGDPEWLVTGTKETDILLELGEQPIGSFVVRRSAKRARGFTLWVKTSARQLDGHQSRWYSKLAIDIPRRGSPRLNRSRSNDGVALTGEGASARTIEATIEHLGSPAGATDMSAATKGAATISLQWSGRETVYHSFSVLDAGAPARTAETRLGGLAAVVNSTFAGPNDAPPPDYAEVADAAPMYATLDDAAHKYGGVPAGAEAAAAQRDPLLQHAWYVGAMSRKECERLVRDADHGQFLVRQREGTDGGYAICVNASGQPRTLTVDPTTAGRQVRFADRNFAGLADAVAYWQAQPLSPVRNVELRLTTPALTGTPYARARGDVVLASTRLLLSCNAADAAEAGRLQAQLETAGFTVAEPCASYAVMAQSVADSAGVVVCVTPRYLEPGSESKRQYELVRVKKKRHGIDLFIVKLGTFGFEPMRPFASAKFYEPFASEQRAAEFFNDLRAAGIPCEGAYGRILRTPLEEADGAIMLSYRWGEFDEATQTFPTQEAVKALRQALEDSGHRVWMDVDFMRGEMDEVMFDVVEKCSVFVACVTDGYFDEGSNAQKEYMHALATRRPGVDTVVVQLGPVADMTPVELTFGSGAVFSLPRGPAGPGTELQQAVDGMTATATAFRDARRVYRKSASAASAAATLRGDATLAGIEEMFQGVGGGRDETLRAALEDKYSTRVQLHSKPFGGLDALDGAPANAAGLEV